VDARASSSSSNIPRQENEVWVTKWVDYTSKYGVGYLLCDGCAGVFFNDSSKMVLEPSGDRFHYIERSGDRDAKGIRRSDGKVSVHTLSDYPSSLKKKVTLLNHFKGYLVSAPPSTHTHTLPPSCWRGGKEHTSA
jgi:polo-like kinase 1